MPNVLKSWKIMPIMWHTPKSWKIIKPCRVGHMNSKVNFDGYGLVNEFSPCLTNQSYAEQVMSWAGLTNIENCSTKISSTAKLDFVWILIWISMFMYVCVCILYIYIYIYGHSQKCCT